jgi:hypothetical protein
MSVSNFCLRLQQTFPAMEDEQLFHDVDVAELAGVMAWASKTLKTFSEGVQIIS